MPITQELLDLLNYFTCPVPSHWQEHEFKVIMLLAGLTTEPAGKPGTLDYESGQALQSLPVFSAFAESLDEIRTSIERARAQRAKAMAAIFDEVQTSYQQAKRAQEDARAWYDRAHGLERGWVYLSRFEGFFAAPNSLLDIQLAFQDPIDWSEKKANQVVPLYVVGRGIRDELNEVFQSLSQLIRAKDGAFNRRSARNRAADRQDARGLSGMKAAREDWEAVRRDVVASVEASLLVINEYISSENADFRMQIGSVDLGYDSEDVWRRARRRGSFELASVAWRMPETGQPLSGLALQLVLPVLDYVFDASPHVKLGVCENPQCHCAFIRPSNCEKQQYCSDGCQRDAS